MENKKKLFSNYFYNLIYQFLLIFLPLVTLPYLSRVLGADGIGTYSYVVSIAAYFILIGTLGLNLYGQKEIAYVQGEKNARSSKFFEIFILKTTTLLISLIFYIIIFTIDGEYSIYYRILIIEIIGNIFDITWFFQGMEEFKKTVIRNSLVKILSTILIFSLIKTKSDLYLYFYIYALSIFLGNLSIWIYLPKYVQKVKVEIKQIIKSIKPAIILLIPQIATQIYTVLDKSMIGVFASTINEVGYYDNAQKIIKVGITIVTAMGVVMLPRISNFFAKGENNEIKEYIIKSFSLVFFLSFPLIFGINAIVDNFVPVFFGKGFGKVALLIKIISPVILIVGMSNILGIQYLLPTKKNKPYIIAVISGALINIILNVIFIIKFDSVGASVATVLAELIVFVIEYFYLRKQFDFKKIFKTMYKYFFAALIMYFICLAIDMIEIFNPIILIIIQIFSGGLSYIIILLLLKEENTTEFIKKITKKVVKNEKN